MAGEPFRHVPLSACPVCSKLADVETSFVKVGHEDEARHLPPEAWKLVAFDAVKHYSVSHTFKVCPHCGIYYQYDFTYEYLVYGSEDEETLARLTPAEARRFMDAGTYAFRMACQARELASSEAVNRRFAARSMTTHFLERHETVYPWLYLQSQDGVTVSGAVVALWRFASEKRRLAELARLAAPLKVLAAQPEEEIARLARYILRQTGAMQ